MFRMIRISRPLTGATITSKAVTKGVREAVEAIAEYAAGHQEE